MTNGDIEEWQRHPSLAQLALPYLMHSQCHSQATESVYQWTGNEARQETNMKSPA